MGCYTPVSGFRGVVVRMGNATGSGPGPDGRPIPTPFPLSRGPVTRALPGIFLLAGPAAASLPHVPVA